MNLKASFQHQKTLKRNIEKIVSYLSYPKNNTLDVTQKHCKKEFVDSKEDEIKSLNSNRDLDFPVDDILKTLSVLIEEKDKLTQAIYECKSKLNFDIDGSISNNNIKRDVSMILRKMYEAKETVSTMVGTDYKINVEGNQVPYSYRIEETARPDYSKDNVKSMLEEYNNSSDSKSEKIDELMVMSLVDYKPIIGDRDSLEDVIRAIIGSL